MWRVAKRTILLKYAAPEDESVHATEGPSALGADEPACVLFTSGSSGRPKGIVNSQRALLQRAGFALPVADSDTLTITYPHLFGLMDDLRSAAQTNMLQQQVQHFTPRGFFADAAAHYAEHYKNAEGELTATVELITLTGWKPAANQQQPAKRGSGKISLVKALQ